MILFKEFICPEGRIRKTTRPRDVICKIDGCTKGIIRFVVEVSMQCCYFNEGVHATQIK